MIRDINDYVSGESSMCGGFLNTLHTLGNIRRKVGENSVKFLITGMQFRNFCLKLHSDVSARSTDESPDRLLNLQKKANRGYA